MACIVKFSSVFWAVRGLADSSLGLGLLGLGGSGGAEAEYGGGGIRRSGISGAAGLWPWNPVPSIIVSDLG